jgi:hypothetical protein
MKVVRIYVAVAFVSFCLGIGAVLFLPGSAKADACSSWCYITVDCDNSCSNPKCDPCRYLNAYYGWADDPECTGPFNCRVVHLGCHSCPAN